MKHTVRIFHVVEVPLRFCLVLQNEVYLLYEEQAILLHKNRMMKSEIRNIFQKGKAELFRSTGQSVEKRGWPKVKF